MNRERARIILNVSEYDTAEEIKVHYRIYALKYHPDKNRSPDAVEKFREVREAYELLTATPELKEMDDYKSMIGAFISNLFLSEDLCKLVVSKLVGLCEKRAIEYIQKIDRRTLTKIYDILLRNKDAFHISDRILESMNQLISEKAGSCILLNPFLEDLVNDNLYKITENGQTFIVPLWHHELIYDNNGADLFVRCCPVLPDNMEIDEYNNIYIHLEYAIDEIWKKETVVVPFGNKTVGFRPNQLALTHLPQTIILPREGLSRIHPTEMFDNTKRKDVVLIIRLTDPASVSATSNKK
jgi:hypothetical protein